MCSLHRRCCLPCPPSPSSKQSLHCTLDQKGWSGNALGQPTLGPEIKPNLVNLGEKNVGRGDVRAQLSISRRQRAVTIFEKQILNAITRRNQRNLSSTNSRSRVWKPPTQQSTRNCDRLDKKYSTTTPNNPLVAQRFNLCTNASSTTYCDVPIDTGGPMEKFCQAINRG